MRTRLRKQRKNHSAVLCVVIGVLIAASILLTGAAIIATMILNETITITAGRMVGWALTVIATFGGCIIAMGTTGKEKKFLIGGVTVFCFLLILIAGNVLLFDSDLKGFLGGALSVFGGTAAAFLISGRGKKGVSRHRKMYTR